MFPPVILLKSALFDKQSLPIPLRPSPIVKTSLSFLIFQERKVPILYLFGSLLLLQYILPEVVQVHHCLLHFLLPVEGYLSLCPVRQMTDTYESTYSMVLHGMDTELSLSDNH